MTVKLLLDENISPSVARILRDEGIDVCTTGERGLNGATDAQVFDRAYREDRIVVTANVADFAKLARSSDLHGGIVLLERGNLTRAEQLELVRR